MEREIGYGVLNINELKNRVSKSKHDNDVIELTVIGCFDGVNNEELFVTTKLVTGKILKLNDNLKKFKDRSGASNEVVISENICRVMGRVSYSADKLRKILDLCNSASDTVKILLDTVVNETDMLDYLACNQAKYSNLETYINNKDLITK